MMNCLKKKTFESQKYSKEVTDFLACSQVSVGVYYIVYSTYNYQSLRVG